MKILWRIIAAIKFLWLPPLAALVIWVMSMAISSSARFLPYLLDRAMFWVQETYGEQSLYVELMNSVNVIFQFIHKVVYGINCWLPLDLCISCFLFCLSFKFKWTVTRLFIKLITFGKV